ncbi:MAG TPA: helix-turn-helix transcriptional regulator [Pelagibacterium sp.]|uniref:helix-turn-helix transcriptional regulator n=1 Tax=Pelagibacterium sp. TaxID=1967288 RepID=UPI002C5E7615|nr:helix-turn-helix transcriptional regulator [Pelagibacterium sp.]HWJ86903.1 helix-turn-helix transcriptional regulator [Pelagibacterium sp.]
MTEKGKFPNGLAFAMSQKNIGPTELGRRAGIAKQNIDRWAKQERRLNPDDALKLAPLLDTTPAALLLLEGNDEQLSELIKIFVSLGSAEHQKALVDQARVLATAVQSAKVDQPADDPTGEANQ